ncbi:hypothetical protein [Roseibium sp.]|uniref:hypothetical protein n=1 Tax=Roseibium sp. TaxID=1936156 RepID=UPI003B500026
MDPVVLSVATLFFGFLATLTALGGDAVRPGGRYWELNGRGYLSVGFLVFALAFGTWKEFAQSGQEDKERNSFEQRLSSISEELAESEEKLTKALKENAALSAELRDKTEQISKLLTTRNVDLRAEIENGVFNVIESGSGGANNQYDAEMKVFLGVSWDTTSEDYYYFLFQRPLVQAPKQIIDVVRTDKLNLSDNERVTNIPLRNLGLQLDRINRLSSPMIKEELKENEEVLDLSYTVCIRIKVTDGFGGNYIFEEGFIVYDENSWSDLLGRKEARECFLYKVEAVAPEGDPTFRTRRNGQMVNRLELDLSKLAAQVYLENLDMTRLQGSFPQQE